MNEKLNHCNELAELLRTHLSEKHSFNLEWGIIVLIAIEVCYETRRGVDGGGRFQYPSVYHTPSNKSKGLPRDVKREGSVNMLAY